MLQTILYSCFAGVVFAVCITVISKNNLGRFVKKLIDDTASTEATAKTLAELGFERNFLVRQALKNENGLGKVVKTVSDGDEVRYYIPEETSFRAESLYNPNGGSIIIIFIAAVIFIALVAILLKVIPNLVEMATNAFS